jgi:hypothetical protein
MSRPDRNHQLFLVIAAVAFLYALIFPLMTADTLLHVVSRAPVFETRNLFLILYLEVSRLVTTVIALAIAAFLIARAARQPDGRALALTLLFSVITYEKVFGSNGFPGPLQERLTHGLLAIGVTRPVLAWLFAPLAWPVWFALAALLRFSAVFPNELQAETLDASGRADRRGFMRSRGVAGADIGAWFRKLSNSALTAGLYRPSRLIALAVLLAVANTLLGGTAAVNALWLVALLLVALAVTNLRAGYVAASGPDRVRATWIAEGFVLSLFLFLLSSTMWVLMPLNVIRMAAFILVMLIPPALMACLALSVLDRGELDSANAIELTVRLGTLILAVAVVFGVLYQLMVHVVEHLGMSHALNWPVAALLTAIGFTTIRTWTERMRLEILERPPIGRTDEQQTQ